MKILKLNNKDFYDVLKRNINTRFSKIDHNINIKVRKIIQDVKKNGDVALIKYAKKFDKIELNKKELLLSKKTLNQNIKLDKNIINSFKKAIANISLFHKKQFPSIVTQKKNNVILQSQFKPIESVGLYVPGGKAFYPSSLIMNVVPAKIAGVKRIVCVTPPNHEINPYFIALLRELKIKETYFVGGAQGIAALALGTKTIKAVNKIFGPGNAFVAEAKKQLFGTVGIDLIAGPSEIIVVADKKNNPKWVAADLMAQAEHDINAQSILITDNLTFAKEVLKNIEYLNKNMLKKKTISRSLNSNGLILLVNNFKNCADIINFIAPEHLHLHIKSYKRILPKISNAGGIFLGEYSAEAFGDYIVGTNHILPTSGAAKFSSGLGVLDFMKRSSIVQMNSKSFQDLSNDTKNMAGIEGLEAHKMSVTIRQKK